MNGAVMHSGDNKTGEGQGDDEFIRIDPTKLNPSTSIIMFVVSAYSEGNFS
jgi:stress response protein SCP2